MCNVGYSHTCTVRLYRRYYLRPIIKAGKDPNRPVTTGMLGSFNDAPGGFKEELKESKGTK